MAKRSKAQLPEEAGKDELLIVFGKNVREARRKVGLTQAELGKAAGLAQSYIFEIETMGANVTLSAMAKIASSLRVSLKDLIPANEFETLTPAGVTGLIAVLDKVSETLSTHSVQASELLTQVQRFAALRGQLERLAGNGERE